MRHLMLSFALTLSLLGAICGDVPTRAATGDVPHWTLCKLHYRDPAHFLRKRCFHYDMPAYRSRTVTGHWWHEVKHTSTLSVRITYPTFAPVLPNVTMSERAIPCAWAWRGSIAASSAKYGVPTAVIAAVICVESSGNQYANSCTYGTDTSCSKGLMQLLDSTCAEIVYGPGAGLNPYYVGLCAANLYDPSFNINAGTKYLLEQYRRFGYSWYNAAGAYNAGSWVNQVYVSKFAYYYS